MVTVYYNVEYFNSIAVSAPVKDSKIFVKIYRYR